MSRIRSWCLGWSFVIFVAVGGARAASAAEEVVLVRLDDCLGLLLGVAFDIAAGEACSLVLVDEDFTRNFAEGRQFGR